MEEKKNNIGLIVFIVMAVIVVIFCCIKFVFVGKVDDQTVVVDFDHKAYRIGDIVSVQLNDNLVSDFYVLVSSKEDEEFVTLFADKNINKELYEYSDSQNNEFNGSFIESKLNELTSSWTNVKEKRLITVEEINGTGLIQTLTESRDIDGYYPRKFIYVMEDSFLFNSDNNGLNEHYWTMSKVDKEEEGLDLNDGRSYVYYVSATGSIDVNNVLGNRSGIRPVIVVSKKYIK